MSESRAETVLPSTGGILQAVPASRRAALLTAIMLIGTAVVHLIDGPGSLNDTFYVGALELALAAACVPLALVLIVQPARAVWIAIVCSSRWRSRSTSQAAQLGCLGQPTTSATGEKRSASSTSPPSSP